MDSEKKNSKGLVIITIILAILVVLLCVYIGYDKFLSKGETTTIEKKSNTNNENNKNIEKSEEIEKNIEENNKTETNETVSIKAKCYGTYYVNGDINDEKYILREDGTYYVENKEMFGVFTINENTITFIEKKHTTGPREEDPIYYNPASYLISDDCSMIRLTESSSHTSAYLKKLN